MKSSALLAAAALAMLAACDAQPVAPSSEGAAFPADDASTITVPPDAATATAEPGASPRPQAAAAELTLAEWRAAENRGHCAPLVLTGPAAAAPFDARRADFGGGWAVAFDQKGRRSAYGVAGTGLLDGDEATAAEHEQRLRAQWPHVRTLGQLPQPSFAGYGVEGAQAYPADNPDGNGLNSLAYVRVAGQRCTYNVWSRLGRAHLEAMLDSLRLLPTR